MQNELFYDERLVFDKQEAIVSTPLARATSFLRVMPDFFVIGVQKGGTTSLYDSLLQHPQIIPSKTKEMFYYGNDSHYAKGIYYYKQFFATKIYKNFQSVKRKMRVYSVDASTDTFENWQAPSRILANNEEAKIILLFRNPVHRAFSHYKFSVKKGFESADFEKALELEEERIKTAQNNKLADKHYNYVFYSLGYRSRGIYCESVLNWIKTIPKNNIYINSSEEYFEHPKKVFYEISDFLGIKNCDAIKFNKLNEGSSEKMKPETFNYLNEFYKPYNEKLFKLINKNFNW